MQLVLNKPSIFSLEDSLFEKKQLQVSILRLDTIHPFISGNKWYKLKYNLEEFERKNFEFLVTFGGAYSNHIVATAAAGREFGFKTIGIIRGEELIANSNEYLKFASSCGMKLIFVSREEYQRLRDDHSHINSIIPASGSGLFVLPEGGSNKLAVKGCEEIRSDIPIDFDVIVTACGTGATLSGIVNGLKNKERAVGISVLKGAGFLEDQVNRFTGFKKNYQVILEYHFGGYAKSTSELEDFCKRFTKEKNVPVEPVYTGKLFYGLYDLIRKDFFERGEKIVAVHSGGIYPFSF